MIEDIARKIIFDIKPYVPGKPIEEVERELGIKDVIKMASNENPFGPSPRALEAMREALHKISMYPDGNCFYLKDMLAEMLFVEPDNLVVGNGSDEILKLLAEAFLDPGDEIVIAQPSFSEYEFVGKIMGANCVFVPLKDFTHDLESMGRAVTEKTKIVFICNPNNPTGTIVTKAETDDFLKQLDPRVLVVFDEAYYEYVEDEDYPQSLDYVGEGQNVIVLRTFSKIYGLAGQRIGYGIAKPDIISALHRVREPFNVNLLAQVAALAAVEDQEHLEKSIQGNREGKDFLFSWFEKKGINYVPTQANFIFLQVGVDSQEVFQEMMKLGVIVRTGDIFGHPDFIRITVGTMQENRRFTECLEKVLRNQKAKL
ncbi:histidinol-phosphate transaminase [Candidatus Contubernalis alkaliaceticus]|uniref:histidinol-phosphate transaminase n=1 Tax=Candidatus Contubernalis alkaliaceticus TaxID=338645 RepID=UPI001F4C0C36|nr:histidinol-phosphate transaminase [Candidatus Contubernalis alkalaceticus]UNC91441.1 histidinol-phosphate transaminase [Candidatus Contubernalis alkalaceticus]